MNLTIKKIAKAIERHAYGIHEAYFEEILKIFKDPSTKMIGTIDNVPQVEYFINSPIMDLNFCHTHYLKGNYSMRIRWIMNPSRTSNYPRVEVQKTFIKDNVITDNPELIHNSRFVRALKTTPNLQTQSVFFQDYLLL